MTTIPNGSLYESFIDNYLGQSYADAQAGLVTQKDVLWAQFLTDNGLSASNPLVVAQDPAILSKFMKFVQNTYDSMQTNSISPDEVTRRGLMFSVYDLIVLMLQTLQNNVGVVANNVAFLTRYQKEYSTMMGREAGQFYIAGSKSLPDVNFGNLSKWTLGYGQITMQDYLDTAIQTAITGGTQSYVMHSVNSLVPLPDPTVFQNQEGNITDALAAVPHSELIALGPLTRTGYSNFQPQAMNDFSVIARPNSIQFQLNYKQQYDTTIQYYTFDSNGNFQLSGDPVKVSGFYDVPVVSPITNFPPDATAQQRNDIATQAFNNFLLQPLNNSAILPPGFPFSSPLHFEFSNIPPAQSLNVSGAMTSPINMYNLSNTQPFFQVIRNITTPPWNKEYNKMYTSSTDEAQNAQESGAARRRATKNSLLQQYVTDTQSKRQILSNQADAQNSQQNQAQTGFNQAAGLLKTMIGQLSTIMTSIFS
ncbi:MAG: hypothetical protein JSR37_01425 [Verrucomicrobia bacterium]|nr:hypothetical protein [Verrucomicrobiota bacterium]MBS0637822.1 hypothetical protein [Verrucomicrobiota bacterium]